MLKAKGINTFVNDLSEVPEGALLQALNTIIDRDGIIESRRGFADYGTAFALDTTRAKQLFSYKDRVIRHSLSALEYDSDGAGTWSTFSGVYSEVETGLRIKGIEANGNFYFTTSSGIKKISATSANDFSTTSNYILDAGGVKAVDGYAVINYVDPGFFIEESKVAYRVVWGYKDANSNLIIGTPSPNFVVTNYSTTNTGTVDITFTIPAGITTSHFYQIYRTAVFEKGALPSTDDINPGDECYLIIEDNPTEVQITASTVTLNDSVPEDFRRGGTLLYTNQVTGEGILQANEPPPLARDITVFKGHTFYANTKTRHRNTFSFLSVDGIISGTTKFIVSNGATTNEYTFRGAQEVTDITCLAQAAITDQDFFIMYAASDALSYFVWYDKTGISSAPTDLETEGKVAIRVDISVAVTAADVAIATATAVDAISDFGATNLGAVVTVTNRDNGNTTNSLDSVARPTGFSFSVTTQGDGEDVALKEVLLSNKPTVAQRVDETARSLVEIINRQASELVYAYYLSTSDGLPGEILLESRSITDSEFYIGISDGALAGNFNPALAYLRNITSNTLANPTVVTTSANHLLNTNDQVIIYGSNSTPTINGIRSIAKLSATTFSVAVNVTVAGTAGFALPISSVSTNEETANRVYYSKLQQPEAVPILNYVDVGARDKEILRILPLRDSLFVLKEDGIYRISGEANGPFGATAFDTSTYVLAADSAAAAGNQIYVLTSQGVAAVNESGVSVISRPIEEQLLKLTIPSYTNFHTATWAVGYESDRAYLLWTVTSPADTVATQCFRYNFFTQAWTKWSISATCGNVNFGDDKLYLGASDREFTYKERKNLDRTDFADREISGLTVGSGSVNDDVITLSSVVDASLGDVLLQTQYLTIAQFNRLLKKLDLDLSLDDADYFSTLGLAAGDNLTNAMNALVAKLNIDDTSTVYTFSGATTFNTIQTEFNALTTALNVSTGVFYTNYEQSTGIQVYEVPINAIDRTFNRVTVEFSVPFLQGPLSLFKGIACVVEWVPQHFGNPAAFKHIREGTLIFDNFAFTRAKLSYNSDLSRNFETIEFLGEGIGLWGQFVWGDVIWGGEGSRRPLRTLIPQQKQRCRFMGCKFEHYNAREIFSLYGISLEANDTQSTRGYR